MAFSQRKLAGWSTCDYGVWLGEVAGHYRVVINTVTTIITAFMASQSPTRAKAPNDKPPPPSTQPTATPAPTGRTAATPSPSLANSSQIWSRLATPVDRSTPPPPIERGSKRSLSPVELKRSLDHLYTQSFARRREAIDGLERSVYHTDKPSDRPISREDTDAIVNRLYAQELAAIKDRHETLSKQLLAKSEVRMKRFTDKVEQAAAIDRLYNTAAREREESKTLFEQYNWHHPRKVKPKADIQEMCLRYFKGGFGRRNGAPA
jgi:hypothetical protein